MNNELNKIPASNKIKTFIVNNKRFEIKQPIE